MPPARTVDVRQGRSRRGLLLRGEVIAGERSFLRRLTPDRTRTGSYRGEPAVGELSRFKSSCSSGSAEDADEFGSSIAVGDADGDGCADLAVGAPGEDVGAQRNAGSVLLLEGRGKGLLAAGSIPFTQDAQDIQDAPGTPGTVENGTTARGDRFGKAVQLVDATRDGRAELVIGTPGENDRGGGAWVLRGAVDGATGTGSFAFGLGTGPGGGFDR
ncbi:FG-GAP repeat protein [Streptomyces sp. NEAU-W12]|uniref:FG-GAP repeat protein n=1 Tax=Streptomyces sp. NEAU-W12 TaxID=2994668 RepID=UPI00224B7F9E|nr:FG-GAP repeat protein [Streptomyces sp. NEAU-W12]MCX2926526.1 FG-GAP repeat protein [Streptomyces sp. NEAU-W12]